MKSSLLIYFLLLLLLSSRVSSNTLEFLPFKDDSTNDSIQQEKLFNSEEIINITLSGEISKLLNDREKDSKYHPLTLTYINSDSIPINLEIKAKTRGNFRRKRDNCSTPPLWLKFKSDRITQNSIFQNQNKLKLVTPCQNDKYVVREYLTYKIYQLITHFSFRVQLVRIIFDDISMDKKSPPKFGIIMEDEDKMARRNHAIQIKQMKIKPTTIHRETFHKMAVFQYMIGNTDWSVQYLHNIKLLANDSIRQLIAVPYDFDHAGIVHTPYAKPAPELRLSNIRVRRYRGYCIENMKEFASVFSLFNNLKDEIYSIYTSSSLLSKGYKKQTIRYLDEFYKTINSPKESSKAFRYPCNKSGTGNIVIKGLGKN